MSVVVREIIKFLEKETHKELTGKPYRISSGKEGDVILMIRGEKPFILKNIKKENFYKFVSIGDATKINKLLISAKVNERKTYYLVNVYGFFLYGIKKTYVCEGKPNLVKEGQFLKYNVYRFENRKYYYVTVHIEVVLKPNEFTVNLGNPEKKEIAMEEYLYTLDDSLIDKVLPIIEEIRKEFERRTISKDFLSMTKKEIAVGLMREIDNLSFRAWYCSRRGRLPKICENPFAFKALVIYEQFYQAMKKLQILVFNKERKSAEINET